MRDQKKNIQNTDNRGITPIGVIQLLWLSIKPVLCWQFSAETKTRSFGFWIDFRPLTSLLHRESKSQLQLDFERFRLLHRLFQLDSKQPLCKDLKKDWETPHYKAFAPWLQTTISIGFWMVSAFGQLIATGQQIATLHGFKNGTLKGRCNLIINRSLQRLIWYSLAESAL